MKKCSVNFFSKCQKYIRLSYAPEQNLSWVCHPQCAIKCKKATKAAKKPPTNKNPQISYSTPLRKKTPSKFSIYCMLTIFKSDYCWNETSCCCGTIEAANHFHDLNVQVHRTRLSSPGNETAHSINSINSINHLQLHIKQMHLYSKPWRGKASLSPVHTPGSEALLPTETHHRDLPSWVRSPRKLTHQSKPYLSLNDF